MCCPLVFEFSVGIGGFVIGLGQISYFFSSKNKTNHTISSNIHSCKYCNTLPKKDGNIKPTGTSYIN